MASLRAEGIEPVALVALLARLGTSDPVEPVTDAAPLIESIDFARFGRAPARFDEAELALLNQKILHHTPHAAVAGRQIGRASCRESVCQYVSISVVGVFLKQKQHTINAT